jgi:hypothetical protein
MKSEQGISNNNKRKRTMTSSNNSQPSLLSPLAVAAIGILITFALRYFKNQIRESRIIGQSPTPPTLEERLKLVDLKVPQPLIDSGTDIVDSFLKDEELLHSLTETALWRECMQKGTKWWDGKSQPQNLWEILVGKIWFPRPESDNTAGFEYWCNILEKDTPLAWHVDKDEEVWEKRGELRYPSMGAVFYGYPHTFEGGYLEMINADVHDLLPYERTGDQGDIARIRAEYNRMVILNVSKWHQVSGILDHGERYTFAANVWHGEKPKGL